MLYIYMLYMVWQSVCVYKLYTVFDFDPNIQREDLPNRKFLIFDLHT